MKSIAILLLVGSVAATKLYRQDVTMAEYEDSGTIQTDQEDAAKAKLSMDDLIKQQGTLMETDAKTIKDYQFML